MQLTRANAPWPTSCLLQFLLLLISASCASNQVTPVDQSAATAAHSIAATKAQSETGKIFQQTQTNLSSTATDGALAVIDRYVNSLVATLDSTAVTTTEPPTFHTLRDPTINAYIYPNGTGYITTGLIAVLETEAQLALVLAHELAHLRLQHSLRQKDIRGQKNNKRLGMSLFTAGVVASATGALIPGIVSTISGVVRLRNSNSLAHELEHEADDYAIRILVENNYDALHAASALQLIRTSLQNSSQQLGGGFSSHPSFDARIASYRKVLAEQNYIADAGLVIEGNYAQARRPAVIANALPRL